MKLIYVTKEAQWYIAMAVDDYFQRLPSDRLEVIRWIEVGWPVEIEW